MVAAAMIPTLEAAVVRRRGKAILGPLDLSLRKDGITILLGPNGSGKTTLLRVLHGVERLSGGARHWQGAEEVARARQAYVFQTPTILRRTVRQNLAYPLELIRTPKAEVARATADWAGRIGLTDALDRYAPNLSGGEKQKLALARALIRDPGVLFLDEPSANLDGRATREIESLLLDSYHRGTRIVMATHDLGQARRLATEVIFLVGGQLHETGAAPGFFTDPATTAARAFLDGDIVD